MAAEDLSPRDCIAVIFTSRLAAHDDPDYGPVSDRMDALAAEQPGFIRVESARGPDGLGITVSYWADAASARAWKETAEHLEAQRLGRERWYAWYRVDVARVERSYGFHREGA